MVQKDVSLSPRAKLVSTLAFCIIGIAINVIGSQVVSALGLPLYVDCIGTIMAAAVGGYIPGIAVGYITNILNSFADGSSLYYSVTSVLIAVAAAYAAQKNWLKKPGTVVAAIVVFALIGGVLGSLLTWCLYGADYTGDIALPLVRHIETMGVLDGLGARLLADFLLDIIDKAITVVIVLVIVRLLPSGLSQLVDCRIWQQRPLSDEERRAVNSMKPRKVSIHKKIVTLVALIMVLVAIATTAISFLMFNRSMEDTQAKIAWGIVDLAAKAVDGDKVPDYLEQGEAASGYTETESALATIRNSFADVQYVYVYQIDQDGCHVVFDPDTPEEEGSDPGEVIPFDQEFVPYLDDLYAGASVGPIVSDESYGWLLSVYQPITNSQGRCVAYACADVSMDHIIQNGYEFLWRIIALFAAFLILVCVLLLWLARYLIVLPLKSIALVTKDFAFDSFSAREDTLKTIHDLDIHTGDEIENLYRSVRKTANDTMAFIAEDQKKNETISRMQDNLIMVMADLVESRDKFTGDHVRKTAAYTQVIMEQMRKEGIYADELTDEFVSNVIHSAPLHDIGKISISDMLLNKPGRLTDEEFQSMQNHTTAGKEILEGAVDAVSEPTYLDEAKNLAAYHHEKWDGSGYPCGLSGEEIPLSARIMAVADVFDALVSKRSYKEGFPIDRAMDIIREGAGTHFDPLIAEAFLHAEEAARRIALENGDGAAEDGTSEIIDPHSQPEDKDSVQ